MKISPEHMISFPPVGMLPSGTDPEDAVDDERLRSKKKYEINEISLLSPGDILVLHTDGLSEHASGDYFPGRVEELLVDCAGASAAEICDRLREDLLAHAAPEDDLSVVVIRRTD